MIFADLPVGSSIFLDANTFIYHFTAHSVLDRLVPNCFKESGSTNLRVSLQLMSGILCGGSGSRGSRSMISRGSALKD